MSDRLPETLTELRGALARSDLALELPDVAPARAEVAALLRQLDDYLLPRLARLDAPLLVVVGGSTGAGKSTLVNSIVGRPVSPAGVLRPTTRAPVLVHHPQDQGWFGGHDVLAHLPRADESGGVAGALRLVSHWRVPAGLALLDAPDLDSVVALNRDLATQLLAAADLWLFVTSAARYADAVPWQALRAAQERSTAVAVILDRVPPAAEATLHEDLSQLLAAQGLADAPLFTVAETTLDDEGLLPEAAIEAIRRWLAALAGDQSARAAVIRRSLSGALAALGPRLARVASAVAGEERAIAARRADVLAAFDGAVTAVDEAIEDGSLLKGEVLARWQELVGTGQLMHGLEVRVGRWRDRFSAAMRGRATPAAQLEVAIEGGVEALVRGEADNACDRAYGAWRASPDGRALLEALPPEAASGPAGDLSRSSDELPDRVRQLVREWQAGVLELVRSQGAGRRRSARLLSYGVNGLGLLIMVAAFAHTGGLLGVEAGVAAGTSVLGQRLLEALLGDQAVRRLATKAREDLQARVRAVLELESNRFLARLPQPATTAEALADVAAAVASTAARAMPAEATPLPAPGPEQVRP